MQLIYHPRDINSKSAHSIVVNDSKILQKFLKVFSVEKTASLVKEFPAKHKDPNGPVKRKEGDVFNNGACSGQNVGEVKDGQTSYEVLEPEVKRKVQLTKQSMPRIHKGSTTSEAQEQMKFMLAQHRVKLPSLAAGHPYTPTSFIRKESCCGWRDTESWTDAPFEGGLA